MSTRPREPEFLIRWREWLANGPPKCCHTCEHFNQSGMCLHFVMPPPEEFAATQDACVHWIMELPF